MKYRRLGKTNLKVSVVGIGTWQFGEEWGKTFMQEEVDAMFDKGRELGINLVDTAECYGDHLSESLVGQAIRRDRSKWIVATKFGHKFDGFMQRQELWTAKDVLKQLEDSLKALRTDYLDIYQFHSGKNEWFDNEDLWNTLRKQVQAGKIRHLGDSLSPSDNVHQVQQAHQFGIEVMQIYYNRISRKPETTVFPLCIQENLGVLTRVPLASGLLSGKYKPGAQFPDDDVRHNQKDIDARLREVEEIRQKEVPPGVDMAQWALAWCLQHPAVTCVIPGCKSAAQVESNARAADLPMVKENHPQVWK